jgi:hypothetical protein
VTDHAVPDYRDVPGYLDGAEARTAEAVLDGLSPDAGFITGGPQIPAVQLSLDG